MGSCKVASKKKKPYRYGRPIRLEVKVIQKVASNQLKIGYEVASRLVVIATRGFLPCQNSYGHRVILSLEFFFAKNAPIQSRRQANNPNYVIFCYLLVH